MRYKNISIVPGIPIPITLTIWRPVNITHILAMRWPFTSPMKGRCGIGTVALQKSIFSWRKGNRIPRGNSWGIFDGSSKKPFAVVDVVVLDWLRARMYTHLRTRLANRGHILARDLNCSNFGRLFGTVASSDCVLWLVGDFCIFK